MAEAVGGLLGVGMAWLIYAMILIPVLAFAVVAYILGGMSMYAIAKRRGIPNAWMAWVPVVSFWILGSVADDYAMKKYAENRNFRTILLILAIISSCSAVLTIFPIIGSIVTSLVTVARTVFSCMATYQVFASCKPNRATMFLLLDIFTPAGPFLLMSCRDSDEGMPAEPQA